MSERKRASGVERRAGGERKEKVTATSTVHEVAEVYVYIPPELSAAGVELKLAGSVRIVNKVCLRLMYIIYTQYVYRRY